MGYVLKGYFDASFRFKYFEEIHSCLKLKLQPVLSFSSFVHNSSINEHKNMKLKKCICYEIINWTLHYCGFGNNLLTNNDEIFL